MKVKKAIIPAAGLGTRFLPATKSCAKEMLPIVDKPCIQYLVEEAVASGIEEIIIITGSGKRSIEDHFDFSAELYQHLEKKGKKQLVRETQKIEQMAKFSYVRQPYPQGDGDAILCAKHLVGDEPVAIMFGDDIYDSKVPALSQLINAYKETDSPVIALEKIPKKDSDKYGMVAVANKNTPYQITELVEKPKPENAPSNLAITGKYIVTPELLEDLSTSKSATKDKELRLIDGMRKYVKHSPIYGIEIDGERFDTGDKLGYLKAVVHFGLKHPELGSHFKKHLSKLDF